MNKKTILWVMLVVMVALIAAPAFSAEQYAPTVNASNPGQKINNLNDYIVKGKTTIIDFYSPFCPPCKALIPRLEQLDKKRADVVVVKFDINRKDVNGIDWKSPLAEQFNIRSVPCIFIADPSGKLMNDPKQGRTMVNDMLSKEGI